MPRSDSHLSSLLLLLCVALARGWKALNIEDFGARSGKDSTDAIRSALAAAGKERDGAEVLVPKGGSYLTAPLNITSNVILRVDGNLTGLPGSGKVPHS